MPGQPCKHTLPEERRPAKSVSLKLLLNILLLLTNYVWVLLPDNIVLLKLLVIGSSVEEKQQNESPSLILFINY